MFSESGRVRFFSATACVLAAGLPAAQLTAQTKSFDTKPPETNQSVLQRRYDAAEKYQAAHDLERAAQQYRIFIADALGQVALGNVHAGEYDKGANAFDEALSLVPDFPTMQLAYARAALDDGKLERARLLATAVLRERPADPKLLADAHAILGRVLLKLNKDAEAKQQIEEAVALDPTFENGYELAVAELDLGDGKGAAKIFSEMLSSFGDTAAIHLYFGQAYGNSDFQANSVEEFKKAIAKDPKLPGVHYSLAAAYLSTAGSTKLREAEAELRKEIVISPKDAAPYAALGHLLAGEHRGAATDFEAENDLKRATELDPRSPDGFLYLGQFYADAKKPAEAKAALRRSISLTSDVSRNAYQVQKAHYLLGRLLVQDGKVEEGKQEIAASQALMQQNLTHAQDQLSDYLQEKKSAGAGSGMGPQMPMTVETKAVDADGLRKVTALEKQIGPAIADSYNNLGAISGSAGDYRGALHYFERAAEWNAALPGLDVNWGRAAFEAGAFSEAVGPLTRSLHTHPEDAATRMMLSGAYAALGRQQLAHGDNKHAVVSLEAALKLEPDNAELRQELAKVSR